MFNKIKYLQYILTTVCAGLFVVNTAIAAPATVAVWDFDNNSFAAGEDVAYLRRALSEMLLTDLAKAPGLKLVERVKLQDALAEQKLGSSELVGEDDRIKLGRILGAKNMVFGSYVVMGKQARIDVRLIDVETSVTKASESAETPLDTVAPAMHKLAQTLAKKMGVSASAGAAKEDTAVWQRYEQGVALMDARKYDEAVAVFKEVLTKNPGFDAAEKQIKLALERQSRR